VEPAAFLLLTIGHCYLDLSSGDGDPELDGSLYIEYFVTM
jgi:hypothetical protein